MIAFLLPMIAGLWELPPARDCPRESVYIIGTYARFLSGPHALICLSAENGLNGC
jgi:hypothetical protein